MNPILQEIISTGKVKCPDGTTQPLAANVSEDQGIFLQELIREVKATKTLEVGMWFGISTLFICDELSQAANAHHITIDPNQLRDVNGAGLNNIKMAGYEKMVEPYLVSSHVALPEILSKGTILDFAFIDASHLFDYTLLEFFYIDKMLRVGGILCFDDVTMPGVRKVCQFMVRNRAYKVVGAMPDLTNPATQKKYERIKQAVGMLGPLKRLVKPEYLDPDINYGLTPGTRCVAFIKEAEDTETLRPWYQYSDF